MTTPSIQHLSDLIRSTFCCESDYVGSVLVSETYKGRSLWSGTVCVFRLEGDDEAAECYGWESDSLMGSTEPVIVPRTAEISSPAAAVRAYILGLCDDCSDATRATLETADMPG